MTVLLVCVAMATFAGASVTMCGDIDLADSRVGVVRGGVLSTSITSLFFPVATVLSGGAGVEVGFETKLGREIGVESDREIGMGNSESVLVSMASGGRAVEEEGGGGGGGGGHEKVAVE